MKDYNVCANCYYAIPRSEANLRRFGNKEHIFECAINDRTPYKLPGETCEKWYPAER